MRAEPEIARDAENRAQRIGAEAYRYLRGYITEGDFQNYLHTQSAAHEAVATALIEARAAIELDLQPS